MAWTTPQDVRSRWLPASAAPTDDEQLLIFIEDVEDMILRQFPSIPSRILAETLPINRVKRIVSQVVIRAMKSGGTILSQFSRGVGPYSESGSFTEEAKKFMTLTAEEIDALSAPARKHALFMTSMAPDSTTGYSWEDRGWTRIQ